MPPKLHVLEVFRSVFYILLGLGIWAQVYYKLYRAMLWLESELNVIFELQKS